MKGIFGNPVPRWAQPYGSRPGRSHATPECSPADIDGCPDLPPLLGCCNGRRGSCSSRLRQRRSRRCANGVGRQSCCTSVKGGRPHLELTDAPQARAAAATCAADASGGDPWGCRPACVCRGTCAHRGAVSLSLSRPLTFERTRFEHLSPAGTAVPASGAVGVYGSGRDRDQTAAVRAGRVQFHLDKVGERRRGVSADSGVQRCTSR